MYRVILPTQHGRTCEEKYQPDSEEICGTFAVTAGSNKNHQQAGHQDKTDRPGIQRLHHAEPGCKLHVYTQTHIENRFRKCLVNDNLHKHKLNTAFENFSLIITYINTN